jgi:hypothetical protein
VGLDATVAFGNRGLFERAKFPSTDYDLEKWIPESKLSAARAMQSDFAKLLGQTGH